jgi:hypothetical protein
MLDGHHQPPPIHRAAPGLVRRVRRAAIPCCLLAAIAAPAHADDEPPPKASSPWILLPTFSNNPKLGAAAGVLGGYAHKFDAESKLSIFALNAQYTSTNSATVALIARTSFDADHQRLNAGAIVGKIKNDYDDYLGTGQPLKTEEDLRALFVRYLYRVEGDWFVGAQAVSTNYQVVGQTALDDDVLGLLGLNGFESAGLGLNLYHDSRDSLDSPRHGWLLNINNISYRQSLEGSADFDVYRLDYRHFWSHGDGHVFAIRQNNQWTVDAPLSAYAPVNLRGYTMGEYLGKYMSSIEAEERHRFADRWTATAFAGVACLYGADKSCSKSKDLYPSIGLGVQYVLKPDKGIVANLEFAVGKEGNNALLFKMGYGF